MATLEDIQAELARRQGISGAAPNAPAASIPAAAAPSGVTASDISAELARRSNPPPAAPAEEPTSRAGLAARVGIQGATGAVLGLPALAMDAIGGPINLMYRGQNYLTNKINQAAGTNIPMAREIPSQLQAAQDIGTGLANLAGTPEPKTPGEKLAVNVGTAGLSAAGPGGYGRLAMLAKEIPALASAGARLAATPVLDIASGAMGEAGSQAVQGKGGTPMQGAVAGALTSMAPYALAAAGRRVVTPLPSNLTPEQQRLATVLQNEGINLSAGQQTGNKGLQFTEDAAAKLPGGDLLVANPRANQSEQFTRAVLGRAGIDASAATPEVLQNAHSNIGQTIGDITGAYGVQFDPQYATDIHSTVATYAKNLNTDQKSTIAGYISDLKNAGGNISGDVYQKTRSNIGRAIRSQSGLNGDPEYKNALIGIQNALDDAAERSMLRAGAVDDVKALQGARQQYANLMTIEDAVARSGEKGAAGLINPSSLSAATKAAVGKRQYARGVGNLNDISRAGDAFIRPLPDSGTAQRSAIPTMAGLAVGGYNVGGPLGAGLAMTLPTAAGTLVNNPITQRYLRNQLFPNAPRLPLGAIPGLLGQ